MADQNETADRVFTAVAGYTKRQLDPLAARLDRHAKTLSKLNQRVGLLAKSAGLEYAGVWSEKSVYREGACVSRDGSLWHCMRDNKCATPGQSDDWKLIVKRGQVGPQGPQGPQGEQGEIANHQWDSTRLRFQKPDGEWGPYVDLRGPRGGGGHGAVGPQGPQGASGAGTGGAVPTRIRNGQTFTVAADTQVLFATNIDIEDGILDIEGMLIEVA